MEDVKNGSTFASQALCRLFSFAAFAVDLSEVEKKLTTTGVDGWIHGSVAAQGLYVYRNRLH